MRNVLIAGLLAIGSTGVLAEELHYEAGYTNFAVDSGPSLNLGALYGTVGYEFAASGDLAHELEGSVFLGIADDSTGGVALELEPSVEAAYRATYQSTNADLRYFFRASYTRIELEGSSIFTSGSVTESESGGGLGIGFEYQGFTLGAMTYFNDLDDITRVNFGYRFR